jgi:Putative Flp pilus-assembly TadE/G-like
MPERQNHHAERGQILPLVGFGIVAILGMVALTVDVGYWRYQQRLEQSAADSAAVAGAIRLNYPTNSSSTPLQAAKDAAAQNGFQDDGGVGNLVVTVNIPPLVNTPPHAGATPYPANTAVEVIVKKKYTQFFSGIFGASVGSGSARAVAVAVPEFSACLVQTTVSNGKGIGITGNKPLQTKNCGVLANGTISVPGFQGTTSVAYWAPDNVGGVSGFPGAVSLPAPATDTCPRIKGCAYLAAQPIPPLDVSKAINASGTSSFNVPNGKDYAVVYNCCSGSPTVLGPGLYYIYGGISGTLQGDGVTLVNVNGGFTASGLGAAHPYFSAPTSGPTAGVAYYQPPANTNTITLNGGGNGTSAWDGIFYAPTTGDLIDNGGSVTFAYLVVGDILVHGGGSGQGLIVDPTLGGQTSALQSAFPTHVVLSE